MLSVIKSQADHILQRTGNRGEQPAVLAHHQSGFLFGLIESLGDSAQILHNLRSGLGDHCIHIRKRICRICQRQNLFAVRRNDSDFLKSPLNIHPDYLTGIVFRFVFKISLECN